MIVGILSDTHDRIAAMEAGMEALRRAGAEYFIHCGDVGGEAILDQLAGVPAAFVWGNNDFERATLGRYARELGIVCLGEFGELELEGKKVAVMHGDDLALRRRVLEGQQFDYLLQGHTHLAADQRFGRTRLINPGALHRARPKSVAVLDLASDRLTVIEVEC
jgi:putative phosphoesterase